MLLTVLRVMGIVRLFQNDEGPLFPHFEFCTSSKTEFCTSSKPPSDLFTLELIQVKFQIVEMGSNQTVLLRIMLRRL